MNVDNANGRLQIRFRTPQPEPVSDFQRAVGLYAAVDRRWIPLLEMAAAGLSEDGRDAFTAGLLLLEAGPAPKLLPFAIEPDDGKQFGREAEHLPTATLTKLGVMAPAILGFGHPEIPVVQGLITAVHRLLRIAKARP